MQTSPNDKAPAQRTYHFSPRPKSVMVRANPAEGDAPLESPSPFKLPKPRQTGFGSPGDGPVSPRFTRVDLRRPVPRLDLFNDLRPMPELPPVPTPTPRRPERTDGPSDDSDVEGEILVEFLNHERYEIVELSDDDTPPSPPGSPSQLHWPASLRSPGSGLPPRGDFLGQKPRDGSQ